MRRYDLRPVARRRGFGGWRRLGVERLRRVIERWVLGSFLRRVEQRLVGRIEQRHQRIRRIEQRRQRVQWVEQQLRQLERLEWIEQRWRAGMHARIDHRDDVSV
jgi:transposase-like protein